MNPYQELFKKQLNHYSVIGATTAKERITKLKALKKALEVDYRDSIKEALYNDFKKPHLDTDLTEIYPVISEIKLAIQKLHSWMEPQPVKTPLSLFGANSWIQYQSKGVCLIISPWNFPVNLTFGPLVSAIAAGNTVILKPSEHTPHTSKLMEVIVKSIFKEEEVALVLGGVEVSTALLELPFHHIFFTGSPKVGKIVMKAASENLSSITLELGGKSPTIVDASANLKKAAKRIAWAKFLNAGQICIAPDYLFVEEKVKEPFLKHLKEQIDRFYDSNSSESSSYCRIVNQAHHQRLKGAIEHALSLGDQLVIGGETAKDNYISPTVIDSISEDSKLMQEEIFGPILPVKTYHKIEEVIQYVNKGERPLALYIYSKNNKSIKQIIAQTRAGSSCINNSIIQYSNHHLPFGGVNNSGIGSSHGFYGFKSFSSERSLMRQYGWGPLDFIMPPYNKFKKKLVAITLKWL